jgi:hypothetical protein
MHVRSCRYLNLRSNQIRGSFPSVVSGLSSLQYVQYVCCVCSLVRGRCAVCCVRVRCASAAVCACAVCAVLSEWVCRCVVRVVWAGTSVQWVCEPCWLASAAVAVVGVRGRSSTRGSAVSTPAVVVSSDACACVQVLGLGHQPDQGQLSVGGVRTVFVDVRAMCAVCVCLCMGGVRYVRAVYSVHLLRCLRALHVWCCVSACVGAWCSRVWL